jgi:response regulator RpfG family c-di-GMP phosphodiesterase
MGEKVLFVDDDSNILASFKRQLRKQFHVETALAAKQGLELVKKQGPYGVIVSDLRMPGMDGIQFLATVRELAPNSVRMMLTGNADLEKAIEAVNEGNIFRFLTKPCHSDMLAKAVAAGIRQYQLITAERELLEKTLSGSIKVLTELLALANPEAFGRSSRIKHHVKKIASHMGLSDVWKLETAAMLSQLGCVTLPQKTLKKLYQGQALTETELRLFNTHPIVTSDLLAKIPRMQEVAEIIAYQEKHFDGTGGPRNSCKGEAIPFGARLLKVVLDFDMLEAAGLPKNEALNQMQQRSGWYDPSVVKALQTVIRAEARYQMVAVTLRELVENMILAEDVFTLKGQLLISRGHEVSRPLVERLKAFAKTAGIKEPIRVIVPLTKESKIS